MGYTHYWTLESENAPTPQEWGEIVDEIFTEFLECNAEKIICREYNRFDEPPEINYDRIIFNGKGENGYETFWLDPTDDGFQFCKTGKKPYDKFVVRALQIAKNHCPNWFQDLSSDGGNEIFS